MRNTQQMEGHFEQPFTVLVKFMNRIETSGEARMSEKMIKLTPVN